MAKPDSELKEMALDFWRYKNDRTGTATNFRVLLFGLIDKADPLNRLRIRAGFPKEASLFELWQTTKDEDAFWRKSLGSWYEERRKYGKGIA